MHGVIAPANGKEILVTVGKKTGEGRLEPVISELCLCPLFQKCSEKQLQKVATIVRPKKFAKGETILREGETCQGFFILRSGMVHMHRLGADGSEQLIRVFHAPESFAEASLFPDGVYPANGRALTKVELWLVPKVPFVHLLEGEPTLALALISNLSRRVHSLVGQYQRLRFGSARERLCHWLLQRDPRRPGTKGFSVNLPGSKAVLAEELGIRQETLSRLLRKLQETGFLQVHGKEIFIPDRLGLATFTRDSLPQST